MATLPRLSLVPSSREELAGWLEEGEEGVACSWMVGGKVNDVAPPLICVHVCRGGRGEEEEEGVGRTRRQWGEREEMKEREREGGGGGG